MYIANKSLVSGWLQSSWKLGPLAPTPPLILQLNLRTIHSKTQLSVSESMCKWEHVWMSVYVGERVGACESVARPLLVASPSITSGGADLWWEPLWGENILLGKKSPDSLHLDTQTLCPLPWAGPHTPPPPVARIRTLLYLLGRELSPPRAPWELPRGQGLKEEATDRTKSW